MDGGFSFFGGGSGSSDTEKDTDRSTDASSAAAVVESWKGQTAGEPATQQDDVRARDATTTSGKAMSAREPTSKPTSASGSSMTEEEEKIMRAPAPRRREKVPAAGSGLVAPAHGLSQITFSKAKAAAEEDTQRWRMALQGRVSKAELKKHRTEGDAWTAVKGRVYNITGYMHIHPGGKPKLMLGAGKDCTALYNKFHPWVNAEYLLDKCFIGFLIPDEE